jgi:NADPH-dependent 2,4-dienoyl-CoA reductase/sulfur reductase-like enzyme
MRLVIIGAGFAGMYAALSAARLRDIKGASPEKLEIALVAPQPMLVVRPRFYEPKPAVDTKAREVGIATSGGKRKKLSYDRLAVATGSRLFRPNIPGLAEHSFSVDSLDDAIALDRHLHGLADRPAANGLTRWWLPAADSPASRRQPRCQHASARVLAAAPNRASSSSSATRQSPPTWAKVRVPSSRMR